MAPAVDNIIAQSYSIFCGLSCTFTEQPRIRYAGGRQCRHWGGKCEQRCGREAERMYFHELDPKDMGRALRWLTRSSSMRPMVPRRRSWQIEQLKLQLEDLEETLAAATPARADAPLRKPVRRPLPDHLPHHDVVHEPTLAVDDCSCRGCGGRPLAPGQGRGGGAGVRARLVPGRAPPAQVRLPVL